MKNKKWEFTKTKKDDSWSIFKIMGEFVEGYEKLSAIGPAYLFLDLLELKLMINIINLQRKLLLKLLLEVMGL